jgi:hypothetical protein
MSGTPGPGPILDPVQVSLTNIDPDDLDAELLATGIGVLGEVVPWPDDVRVHVAGDFVQVVKDTVGDREYAASYTAERLFGRASAKAIGHKDGTTDLVIDAWLVRKENGPEGHDIERLFRHEGLHIAVDQRGESVNDLRLRHGYDISSNRGYFGVVTGVMVEEYRIERALCEAGLWPHGDYLANFGDAVQAFADAAWDGVCLRYPGEPIQRCYETVCNAFHQLATYTGYVAAEMLADPARAPKVAADAKARLLGPAWKAVVASLDKIPPATTPVDQAELERLTWLTAADVERWLEHIGFTLKDLSQGGTYFDVLRHDFEAPFAA